VDSDGVRAFDIVIYGATVAGIAAAIQAARMDRSALLIQTGRHFGGMTTGGLSNTDKGDESTIGGLALAFYRRLGAHYGAGVAYAFEPSVAEATLRAMLSEAGPGRIEMVVQRLDLRDGVTKRGNRIAEIRMDSGERYAARVFIDCSYEGDLMAGAGVSYHVGRESRGTYDEPLAGVTIPGRPVVQRKQFFPAQVSPYGGDGRLLPGISPESLGREGDADRKVQAYCFRLCVTDDKTRRVAFTRPADYDPARYELLARWLRSTPKAAVNDPSRFHHELLPARWLPNRKSDVNDGNPASLDHIGANWDYPDADHATRERIWQDHVSYTRGYLWFIAHDRRVPWRLRWTASRYGYDGAEFRDTGHFPPQLYVREARRMIGAYVVTQRDCHEHPDQEDSIGVASYPVDSHHVQRVVFDGRVANEGNFNKLAWGAFPHEIPYRAIVPRRDHCGNLLVPVCLSSSHVAYGSIRMEPVFIILGQSAGAAAALAAAADIDVQRVDYADLRGALLAAGQTLSRRDARGLASSNAV
jgi:hypothetical protein